MAMARMTAVDVAQRRFMRAPRHYHRDHRGCLSRCARCIRWLIPGMDSEETLHWISGLAPEAAWREPASLEPRTDRGLPVRAPPARALHALLRSAAGAARRLATG